jgi:hypothetical protein
VTRLHRATKHARKLRMALDGPAGGGKTFTALTLGTVLADKVAVIDTERSSASLYADLFAFDVLELEDYDPRAYIAAIEEIRDSGEYGCLIIDSFSHAWEGTLALKDQIAQADRNKDSFGAWRRITPLHNQLVDTVLRYPGHVIATMRAKMDYLVDPTAANKADRVKKVGLAPIQRAGTEFEFDIVGDMDSETMVVSKSRYPAISGRVIDRPGRKLAEELLSWLDDGAPAEPPAAPAGEAPAQREPPPSAPPDSGDKPAPKPWSRGLHIQAAKLGVSDDQFDAIVADFTPNGSPSANDIPDAETANKVAEALAKAVRT